MNMQLPPVLLAITLMACQTAQPGVRPESQPQTTRIASGDASTMILYEFTTAPASRVFTDAIPASMARVWASLPGVYQALGLAVTRLDDGRHAIGSQEHISRGRKIMGVRVGEIVECGRTPAGAPAAESYDLTLSVSTALQSDGEQSTKIETLVDGRARDPVSNNPAVTCTSTGRLERAIAAAAMARSRE